MKKLILILALISTVAYAGIDYIIQNKDQDKDIIVKVNDGGTSTEVMRIDGSSSNVGINETTPANKLHVSETATNSYIARFESNQASNAGIMLRDSSAAADAKNKFIRSSGGELHFGEDVDAENSKTVNMRITGSGFLSLTYGVFSTLTTTNSISTGNFSSSDIYIPASTNTSAFVFCTAQNTGATDGCAALVGTTTGAGTVGITTLGQNNCTIANSSGVKVQNNHPNPRIFNCGSLRFR